MEFELKVFELIFLNHYILVFENVIKIYYDYDYFQLIRNVLNELQDTDDFENKALIIHLSGFLHTSDELALISILEELKIDIGDESKRNEGILITLK